MPALWQLWPLRVSHIVEQLGRSSAASAVEGSPKPAVPVQLLLLVLMASFLHGFIAYSKRPFELGVPVELILGTLNFVVVVFLFGSISTVIYYRRNLQLSLVVLPAILMSLLLTKSDMVWVAMAGWSAVLAPSVLCGRLALHNHSVSRIFLASVVALVLFGSLQMIPMWQALTSSEEIAQLILETEPALSASGYSAENAGQIKEFLTFFLRVLPALTVMSIIMQFALGFWLFARWQFIRGNKSLRLPHFSSWRIPFSFTPLVLSGVLLRLFGNDSMTIIADNLLLFLTLLYSLTGISLLGFLLQKSRLSIYLKLIVYLMLFLSHIYGLAFLALLGFVDSFFGWRQKYPLPIGLK